MKNYLLLVVALLFSAHCVSAQGIGFGGPSTPVPTQINFQGRVAVDNVNFEGSGQFKFALISTRQSNNPFVASPSTILWTNDGTHLSESVTPETTGEPDHYLTLNVAGGLYSVMLGDSTVTNNGIGTPIPMPALNPGVVSTIDGQPLTNLQLRVWFNDGTHGFQQLAPDQKITSVVFAFRAAQAASVDNNSITSDKIAFGAVTELKIASGAVTGDKIADFAITTDKINDGAISGIKLDSGTITESNLANGAISSSKLGDGAVTQKKLGLGYAYGTLADGTLTGANGPTTTIIVTFNGTLSKVPDVSLSGDWVLGAATTSGFSASRVPHTLAIGASSGDISMINLDGLPAVAYKDTTTSTLKFATATDESGSSWNAAVDTFGNGAKDQFQLALIADRPAIGFIDSVGNVIYLYPTNAARTQWVSSLVGGATPGDEAAVSLADIGGRPGIAYRSNSKLRYARSEISGAVGFGYSTGLLVDTTPNSASSVSLTMISGNPAIAYNVDGQEMRFVRANDSSGTAWNAPISINGTGTAVSEITLLTVNGRPAIACLDSSQHQLIYVRANDAGGTSWPAAQVLAASQTLNSVSMSIANGRPAIAFNQGTSLKLLQALDADGSAWGSPVTQMGSVSGPIALAGSANGYAFAYADNGLLKTTGQALSWAASDGTVAPLVAATVKSGGVATAQLANGSVTLDKLDSAVRSSLLPGDGAITTAMLANGAVTSAKIANFAITTQLLDQNAVQAGQLDENAVITNKLANGAVTTAKLADSAITTDKIAGAAVTTDKLAALAVTAQELANNSVDNNHLVNSSVTASKLQNFSVTALKIANNAVGTTQIADQSVTAAKLNPDALGAITFGAGSIHPSNISQNETFTFQAVSTGVLTITGGADVAEPFPVTANEKSLAPGEVLVIDEDNPGHLKRSDRGYDSRVAGIVSGAGGVKPGLTLRQHEVMEGSTQVALTGRVYVKADCSHGGIKPGDLLTTSERPGYAARASDSSRAPGAVIGKAMTALDQGEGLVLVLVSLQ